MPFEQFHFSDFRGALQLLLACPGLRHLDLVNLDCDVFMAQLKKPIYHLSTLKLREMTFDDEIFDLDWLVGQSNETLQTLTTDSLTEQGYNQVLQHLPNLARLELAIGPKLDINFDRVLSLSNLPRLRTLSLVFDAVAWRMTDADLVEAERGLRGKIAELDETSGRKVAFKFEGETFKQGPSSKGSESDGGDNGDDDDDDDDEDYVVGQGGRRVVL